MRLRLIIFHILLAYIFQAFYACVLKPTPGSYSDTKAFHQDQNSKRRLYDSGKEDCKCGLLVDNKGKDSSGNIVFHVHTKTLSDGKWAHCMAIPVTSNIFLTSHRCITRPGKRITMFETWKVRNTESHILSPHEVTVNSYEFNREDKLHFTVKEIIIHPLFVMDPSKSYDKNPNDDVALIVINGNIFDYGYIPFCLSRQKVGPEELFYREAYYLGTGGELPGDETPELRKVVGKIVKGSDCEEETKFGVKFREDTLCMRFRNAAPGTAGGPLLVPGDKQFYVVGLASIVGLSRKHTTLSYAYFSNIFPHIKYIEHYATKHQSYWCPTPDLKISGQKTAKDKITLHPWEGTAKLPPRDESLNCVCGIKNQGDPTARISGGTEATPYEFPWMVRIEMTNGKIASTCGASIINDRMLLTAAHCVVVQYKGSVIFFPPQYSVAVLSSHRLNKTDKRAIEADIEKVMFFPDYLQHLQINGVDTDVAVIVLKVPLNFLEGTSDQELYGLRPLCLPELGKPIAVEGKTADFSGWGLLEEGVTEGAERLQKSQFKINRLLDCVGMTVFPVSRNMLCTGGFDKEHAVQKGDSGSALFIEHEGLWHQIGIASFFTLSVPKQGSKRMDFFVNVQEFLRFIDYYAGQVGAKWCRSSK